MRTIATIFLLLLAGLTYPQKSKHAVKDTMQDNLKKMHDQIDSSMKEMDSINAQINQGITKTTETTDSVYNHLQEEQNNRNLDAFVRMQQEEQEKQKKAMWMRIGLGVFFLAILVFGVMRRKKAK